jgi:hypothetical protein
VTTAASVLPLVTGEAVEMMALLAPDLPVELVFLAIGKDHEMPAHHRKMTDSRWRIDEGHTDIGSKVRCSSARR